MSYSFQSYGKRACILRWVDRSPLDILEEINHFADAIRSSEIEELIEVIPAYDSISLVFQNESPKADALKRSLKILYRDIQLVSCAD